MAGPFENFHFNSRSVDRAEDQVAHSLEAVRKLAADIGEGSIKIVREHPVETSATLCLVGFCLKNPAVREAAKEAIVGMSARVAVGVDDAIMASRREVKFRTTILGRADGLHCSQPISSPLSQAFILARQSVARLRTTDVVFGGERTSNATAFAVTNDGKFVTNFHAVVGQDTFKLVDRFGKQHSASVLCTDPLNDLAVLKLNHPSAYPLFKALKFGKELAPGYHYNPKEEAFCFGYPGTDKLTAAMKSNVEINWESTPFYEKDGRTIIPLSTRCGSSGSPVMNRQGEVTGIVNSGPPYQSPLYHSLSVAIPSDRAKAMVEGSDQILTKSLHKNSVPEFYW
jgi:S1-C subfamily serine protease